MSTYSKHPPADKTTDVLVGLGCIAMFGYIAYSHWMVATPGFDGGLLRFAAIGIGLFGVASGISLIFSSADSADTKTAEIVDEDNTVIGHTTYIEH